MIPEEWIGAEVIITLVGRSRLGAGERVLHGILRAAHRHGVLVDRKNYNPGVVVARGASSPRLILVTWSAIESIEPDWD